MSTPANEMPLPYGWAKQFDPQSSHDFYVDTKANPPRAIWVHPFQDEQFLKEHPDIREKMTSRRPASSLQSPPPYESRRHSYGGRPSTPEATPSSGAAGSSKGAHKRGFLGKLKDKAIANIEEKQRRQQAMLEQQRMYRMNQPSYAQQYAAPQSAYPQRMGMGGMGGMAGMGGRGGGMGGMALPLVGGLAGGLLLGDMMDGGFNDGGGFGGGGGDFMGDGGGWGGGF